MPWVSWEEVALAYDHGVPRCWHAAAVVPLGELYLLSGLTQPYYITMAILIVMPSLFMCLKYTLFAFFSNLIFLNL